MLEPLRQSVRWAKELADSRAVLRLCGPLYHDTRIQEWLLDLSQQYLTWPVHYKLRNLRGS